jgi:glycosyltransferase involved in cell wall biosynthesis
MNNKELSVISVIIPSYGRDYKLLDKAINSVLNQDGIGIFFDVEIIISVNGDERVKEKILQIYSQESSIIVLFTKNKGVSFARNLALKNFKGKYVAFLDDDDTLSKGFLKELYVLNSDVSFGLVSLEDDSSDNRIFFLDKRTNLDNISETYHNFITLKDHTYFYSSVTGKLFERNFIQKLSNFNTDIINHEDQAFWLSNLQTIYEIDPKFSIVSKESQEKYIVHVTENSLSSISFIKLLRQDKKILNEKFENYKNIFVKEIVAYKIFGDIFQISYGNSSNQYVLNTLKQYLRRSVSKIHYLFSKLDDEYQYALYPQLATSINFDLKKFNLIIQKNNDEIKRLKKENCRIKTSRIWKIRNKLLKFVRLFDK